MSDLSKDFWLNRWLKGLRLADHVYNDASIRWGELIEPSVDPRPHPFNDTLRIAVIASLPVGFLTLKTLLTYARHYPAQLHISCLLTDDPLNQDARISARKRIWHLYPQDLQRELERATIRTALTAGIPVYTGDIKQDWFRETLRDLKPDAVLCCGFGQLIDKPFLRIPNLGVYNFHPSDLASGHGAGPAPHEDVKQRNAHTTRWTVHLMNEEIDAGHIIGTSPPINIRRSDGEFPDDPIDFYSKLTDGLDHLVYHTVKCLIEWHAHGQTKPMRSINFEQLFTPEIKARMMKPIAYFPDVVFPDPTLFAEV
ncbi:formyltransferase family protein [uncultured Roseibium sp.]|uniref:formyltransferase family protein n=1 Tax=uncultured Roseibium sp. TaxID=1936171 RepID=UPI00260954A8|nr:formyltransferase family protein [uncultured Roseibium sp.]